MNYTIYTLGCKVNTYESNVMMDLLENANYKYVKNDNYADVVVINSCTVTNQAHNKSLKIIRQAIKNHKNAIIIVCGCVSQTSLDDVKKIDGVSIIIGNKNKSKIIDYIDIYNQNKKQIIDMHDLTNIPFEDMRLNNFIHTRAFVKIQDGCNNFCSYCIIPYTRGGVRSKKKEDVLDEIKTLVNNGHKEIVLTGIHTGNYGAEFDNYNFSSLIRDILKINGLKRLRISSIEMNEITDEIINLIEQNNILVSHMHIPIQSGSDSVLKSMNRKYNKKEFIEKINQLRKVRPEISITTDVIVGFPGETDELFNETIETINTIKFSKLHVFPYSKRDGTKASVMPNQVDDITKKNRAHQLLKLSNLLETNYYNKFIGNSLYVLIETYKNGKNYGHTDNYLMVEVENNENLSNQIVNVIIEKNINNILIGKLI